MKKNTSQKQKQRKKPKLFFRSNFFHLSFFEKSCYPFHVNIAAKFIRSAVLRNKIKRRIRALLRSSDFLSHFSNYTLLFNKFSPEVSSLGYDQLQAILLEMMPKAESEQTSLCR